VLCGFKSVAMTDYSQWVEPDEIIEYYNDNPKDNILREDALKCGVERLYDSEGTEYYFRPEFKKNAEILINHYNGKDTFPEGKDTFPEGTFHYIQGMLLGYTMKSIILYDFIHQINNLNLQTSDQKQEIYKRDLPLLMRRYLPIITYCKKWIKKRDGKLISNTISS
jgi:hypothetical protein